MLTAEDVESLSARAALLQLKSGYASFCDVMEALYSEANLMTLEAEPIVEWMAGEAAPMQQLYQELIDRGVYTFPNRNWVFMAPPPIIDEKALKQGLGAVDEVLCTADKAVK